MDSASATGSPLRAAVIGVSMGPGWIEFARMPSAAYWMAVDLVKMRTAPFDALYTAPT